MATTGHKTSLLEADDSPHQQTALNLLLSAEHLSSCIDLVCTGFGITRHQYNILRILRANYPDGYSTGEIGRRMIERAPDMTRRLELLERVGYVTRRRNRNDRRLVCAYITQRGIDLLDKLMPKLNRMLEAYFSSISRKDDAKLNRLLQTLHAADIETVALSTDHESNGG